MKPHRIDRLSLALLMGTLLVLALARGSTAAAGSDPYGYIAEAELFLRGDLLVRQPWAAEVPWPNAAWTLSPLGFKPQPAPGPWSTDAYRRTFAPTTLVPTYSPGLPMLMAAAARVAGHGAMFWIVPLSAPLLLLATWGIGRRLGSERAGTIAAALLAVNATVVTFALVTMTDLPIAAAAALGIWGALGSSLLSAASAALALALATLIRPNLAPLFGLVVFWLAWRAWHDRPRRARHLQRAALVTAGLAIGVLVTMGIYAELYGSPFESGYGPSADSFGLHVFAPNVLGYLGALARTLTPAVFAGLAALALPIAAVWPRADRSAVVMAAAFVAGVVVEFSLYRFAGTLDPPRFLLPIFPFVAVGLAQVGVVLAERRPRARWVVLAMFAAIGLVEVHAAREVVSRTWTETMPVQVAEEVRRLTPTRSVVLAMQRGGELRYYAGRLTLRWDILDAAWLDRALDWLSNQRIQVFACVDRWEFDQMQRRFAGTRAAARLENPPILILGDTVLVDLTLPPGTEVSPDRPRLKVRYRYAPAPAPPPGAPWE